MKTYAMTLDDIRTLADAVSLVDAYIGGHDEPLIQRAHDTLAHALGEDEHLVYAADDEVAK